MSIFKKKSDPVPETDPDIIILKSTRPLECGGTDAYQEKNAPKTITSDEMTLFDVSSAFTTLVVDAEDRLDYVSAFAAPCAGGTFVLLEKRMLFSDNVSTCEWALVKENVFPKLTALVRERDIARNNGYHSRTHGLPQDFGGSIDIRYASGEQISISDNQSPILGYDAGLEIAGIFGEALKGERVALPDVSALKAIRYAEERDNGGFTRATLTFAPDGTGVNAKASRYDDPTVYESEKPVDAETVEAIRANIARTGIFAWASLPESGYKFGPAKTLTFVFDDSEITVSGDRRVPMQIQNGFFNIELEMTTKH